MNILTGDDRKYSVDRLRCLYGDLLKCIDYENHDILLESRHREAETSPRFGLRRKVFWLKTKDMENDVDERTEQRRRDVSMAFLAMAATRARAHEGSKRQQSVAVRDEELSTSAVAVAKSMEHSIVGIVRSIGEVVVNAGREPADTNQTDLRSDPAFEYFCDKAILHLLVEIACETPYNGGTHSTFHGVVWSPRVKAQIFQTISLLVAGVRDPSALCYLLSQNCMNKAVAGMMPLHQWTDPALETMLPPYVELIKTLSLQLVDNPHLFPFFTVQDEDQVHFPLFSATLLTGISSFAASNSFVAATCTNLIVQLLHTTHPPLQNYFEEAMEEQEALVDHMCSLLLQRYTRMVNLTTGPVVDGVRSAAIDGQIKGLNDQLTLLNDMFGSPLPSLQVRLCENLLRKLILVLWKSCGSGQRPFLSTTGIPSVGVPDTDVIPASEASAQVAYVFLSQFLAKATYTPAIRMLGVALLHERASPLWTDDSSGKPARPLNDYPYTTALHGVVGNSSDSVPNIFRAAYYRTLRGEYGEWRTATAATLMYQCLRVFDTETLLMLDLIPSSGEVTPLENSIAEFFQRVHVRTSDVSVICLECMASLAIAWVQCAVKHSSGKSVSLERLRVSPVMSGLGTARSFFFRLSNSCDEIAGVSDLFVDIVEAVVLSLYRKITLSRPDGVCSGPRVFGYNLSLVGCCRILNNGEILVRKIRGVPTNEVESTRFNVQMGLHFRAVVRVIERFLGHASQCHSGTLKEVRLDMVDRTGELSSVFGCLREKPSPGTDIDIRGRVSFPFFVDDCSANKNVGTKNSEIRGRTFSDDMIFRSGSTLVIVLDPTDMYIVKPMAKHDFTRGTTICCIPLLNVIAAATDADWLHIAVRHDDIGRLIKNGNMALHFDTSGTALIVGNYIDRSRRQLRGGLARKIKTLFCDPASETEMQDLPQLPSSDGVDSSSVDQPGEGGYHEDKKEIDPADVGDAIGKVQLSETTVKLVGSSQEETVDDPDNGPREMHNNEASVDESGDSVQED